MRSMKLLPLVPILSLGIFASASAGVYSCINANGERSISDKPCAPAQITQKVYKAPAPPAASPRQEPEIEIDPRDATQALTPQTPEELEAMLRARARAAQGLPSETEEALWRAKLEEERQRDIAAEKEYRRKTETKRQMETYLNQREQQRQEWRAENQDVAPEPDYQAERQESRRQNLCSSLVRRKSDLASRARQGYSSSSGEWLRSEQRQVDADIYKNGCKL